MTGQRLLDAQLSALRPDVQSLIDVVRIALGVEPRTECGPVTESLVAMASIHGVVPELAAASEPLGVEATATEPLRAVVRREALCGLQGSACTVRLANLMHDSRIRAVIFKGVALGAQTGRGPTDRNGVDVDLLVRPQDWLEAHRVLSAAGYEPDEVRIPPVGDDSRTRFVRFTGYEAGYRGPGADVDLHWRLTPGHPPGLDTEAVLRRAVPVEVSGATVLTLDPDTALAHTVLHGAKDYWGRLRSIVDAHHLVSVAGADWHRAAALVPRSPAFAEARFGVEVVTGSGTDAAVTDGSSTPRDQKRWLDGVDLQAQMGPGGRPPHGMARHVVRRCRLTPGPTSALAILLGHAVTPRSLVRADADGPMWWLRALAERPVRAVDRLVGQSSLRAVSERGADVVAGADASDPLER